MHVIVGTRNPKRANVRLRIICRGYNAAKQRPMLKIIYTACRASSH